MTVLTDRDQTSPASSPYLSAELPTGVLVDGKLQKTALFREMTGYEEDLLGSKRFSDEKKRLSALLMRCIVQIGDVNQSDPKFQSLIASLPDVDLMFCVIKVREASLGSQMRFKAACPCERQVQHDLTVDLGDLKFVGCKDPERKNYSGVLPSGKTYTAKYPDAAGSAELQKAAGKDDYKSLSILLRLVDLGGNTNLTLNDIQELSLRDRNALRVAMNAVEGEYEDTVEVNCQACSKDFKIEVSLADPAFFFPSEP
jgi:hypothetical protein